MVESGQVIRVLDLQNVYGLYDNFEPDSMVIPSIIKKGHKSRVIREMG